MCLVTELCSLGVDLCVREQTRGKYTRLGDLDAQCAILSSNDPTKASASSELEIRRILCFVKTLYHLLVPAYPFLRRYSASVCEDLGQLP